jgi:hypothetical protein
MESSLRCPFLSPPTEAVWGENPAVLVEGHSLADHPDAIGSIPIEITVAGINTLLQSPSVKAIIENQAILPWETTKKRDFWPDSSS